MNQPTASENNDLWFGAAVVKLRSVVSVVLNTNLWQVFVQKITIESGIFSSHSYTPLTLHSRAMHAYSGGVGVNQAYSRLSTTHGHITDCKSDSVVYAGVCM